MKDVEDVVDLTINVFFGALGDDMGFNNCRATAFAQLTDEQEQSIRSAILLSYKIERGSAFKATTSDGRLVGFVTADRGRKGDQTALLLTNLAVSPSERRRNLGRRLVQRVLAAAGERPVVLEVESNNDAAVALYRSCGFKVTGQKTGTRYVVDWWRGRIFVETDLVVMRHEGAPALSGEPASAATPAGDTCDTSDPTGLCVSDGTSG